MSQYAADAELALQKAVVTALSASAAVKAVLGDPVRIYDDVPENPVFPYGSFGPGQAIDAGDGCHKGAEVFLQVDFWSRAIGYPEVKRIAAAAAGVLDAEIEIDGHEIVVHELIAVDTQRGLDGRTREAKLRLRYELAPTA